MSWQDQKNKTREAAVQTGIELQVAYGCELLLKELGFKPEVDWRETMKQRMFENKEMTGHLSEKEAMKMAENLV